MTMTTPATTLRVQWVQEEDLSLAPALQQSLLKTLDSGDPASGVGGIPFIAPAQTLEEYQPLPAGADVVVLCLPPPSVERVTAWFAWPSVCAGSAVVVFTASIDSDTWLRLLAAGAQDIVLHRDAASLPQRLALAVERKRLETELLKAHATDLQTGLPNRPQLIEHMSQLLALRERELRPVSVLVLHIDGLAAVEAAHGLESANVVRRKAAVRLRAGLRASDVVASLGADVFAVLLPAMESIDHTRLVVDKLARAMREPFNVAGTRVKLSASTGGAHFPQDGRQPEALLRHASAQALLDAHRAQDAANE